MPVLGVEPEAPMLPELDEPLVLGLVLLVLGLVSLVLGLVLLPELPLAPMPLVPDEPELPEVLGEVLPLAEPLAPLDPVLPLLPMLVEPLDPLVDGEVVLPLVPAVLLPDPGAPAVSLPLWPHAASDMAAAAITAKAALRGRREAFIWISLVDVWEDEGHGSPELPAHTLGLPSREAVVSHCRSL